MQTTDPGATVLGEPTRTPYDLTFRLFGFPVRVHPLFWIGSLLLGSNLFQDGLDTVLIWVGAVFVSILVHELGHTFAFRYFGIWSEIVLWMFGGLAIPGGNVPGWWRRVAISLAGPGAGFGLLAIVYLSDQAVSWSRTDRRLFFLFEILWMINLYWGLINLLPVLPLDGGRVSEEICGRLSPRNGRQIALNISLGVAGFVCLYSIACIIHVRHPIPALAMLPWWVPRLGQWTAVWFGLLAFQSYQMLQQQRWSDSRWTDRRWHR